jgi:hypothetical protein
LADRVQVGEHAIARGEPLPTRADRLHDAGDVETDAVVARGAEPDEEADELGLRDDPVQITTVHRCRDDPDEELVRVGLGTLDLLDADHVR